MRIDVFPKPEAILGLLDDDSVIKLLPASHYDQFSNDSLRGWCHCHSRYGVPTQELVDWLRAFIGDRSAIEIGSGAGDLARHLKIPATDNRIQEQSYVAAYYKALRQPTIRYGAFVERLDALEAIAAYRPDVVIGCWVTQYADPRKAPPKGGGSVYGIKEDELLRTGVTYVLIGNEEVHGDKEIMREEHTTLYFPWLRSRSHDQTKNRIYIWQDL